MKHQILENWKNGFRHDGLLYFAQRVDEMLFPFTEHVFKSPVLNTALLVDEYLKTAKLAKDGTINDNHLKQIMDEFQASFNDDIVLKKHLEEEEKKRILHRLNCSSLEEQRRMMGYLKFLFSDYNLWCIQLLKELVPQEKEKKKIEKVIRYLIPGLISSGYSREYIYRYNKEIFFDNPVESIDSLYLFLNRFDFKNRQYDIYIAIDNNAIEYQKVLEKKLDVSFGPFEESMGLEYNREQFRLIKLQIESFDEQSAAWEAYDRLNIFFQYYRFLTETEESWFFKTAKVEDVKGNTSFVNLKVTGLNYSKEKGRQNWAILSEYFISALRKNAMQSYIQINRAINAHNTAINDSSIRNRFLNLWSTLEIVFVSDQSDSKCSEIIRKMAPILQNDFLHYLFSSVEISINEIFEKSELNPLLDQLDEEDRKHALVLIIALDKYSKIREELCDLLTDYPLVRSRIKRLHELCSNKKELQKAIDQYTQRIKWHITRLYRTRNTIIHSGINPENLRELVDHLHSYCDECLFEIVFLLSSKPQLESISNALIYDELLAEKNLAMLQEKAAVNKTEIIALLFLE